MVVHPRAHTHTHSSLFLLLPQSVPKAIPDWISGINASEVSIQWTHMSSIKGNPRLVIPNWVNRVACSRHMETTKHLKKMKTGNVLISCIKVPCSQQTHTHTHTHTHTLSLSLPLLVDTEPLSRAMQGVIFLNVEAARSLGRLPGCEKPFHSR